MNGTSHPQKSKLFNALQIGLVIDYIKSSSPLFIPRCEVSLLNSSYPKDIPSFLQTDIAIFDGNIYGWSKIQSSISKIFPNAQDICFFVLYSDDKEKYWSAYNFLSESKTIKYGKKELKFYDMPVDLENYQKLFPSNDDITISFTLYNPKTKNKV